MIAEKEESNQQDNWSDYWDDVWIQKDTSKILRNINKKESLYFTLSGIINSYIKDYIKKDMIYQIIEVGCGGSSIFPILKTHFKNLKIYGIDSSLPGCKFIFENNIDTNHSYDVICGNALRSPIKPESFDIVYSIGLIEHFEKQDDIIKSHIDMLKKNGLIIIVVPNLIGFQGKLLKSQLFNSERALNNDSWINGMKIIYPKQLKTILKHLGCKDIIVKPVGGIHPLLMLEF